MTTALETAVSAWLADSAWEARVILRSASHCLLLLRRRGEPQGWIELGHERSGPEQRSALSRLGLARKRWAQGARAWGRLVDLSSGAGSLSELLRRLWHSGCDAEPYEIEVLAQREQPPENPRLVGAMRAAARQRDDSTRQRLYAALVNATLLVPIDPATADAPAADQRPLSLGIDPHGIPMWAAFSDWDALRQWQPQGHPFGPVHGAEFFSHVHDLGRCTVRINPQGVVGGELYPAEIKAMVDAVRRFYRDTLS